MAYAPDPKLKFTFGLWTVGNVGARIRILADRRVCSLTTRQICELLSGCRARTA